MTLLKGVKKGGRVGGRGTALGTPWLPMGLGIEAEVRNGV